MSAPTKASVTFAGGGRKPDAVTRGREKFKNASERGSQFESPLLRQEVNPNRRDSPRSEMARHFRSLCVENPSLRSVWQVQATFLGAALPKSLAANFDRVPERGVADAR